MQRAFFLLMKVARPMFELCFNTFCCVPKATGIVWALALLVVALLLTGLSVSACIGVYLSLVVGRYVMWAHPAGFNRWPYILAALVISAFAVPLFQVFARLLDIAGDVASYVGRSKRRSSIESRMLRIIEWARERAPHADLIVVGHSLGSVLIGHSLLGASQFSGASLLLVTLGSPLPMMSKVFSGYVLGPRELLQRYSETGIVSRWLNLWRDSDWIGRGFRMQPSERFLQASVGDGLHPNYWADARVWARLLDLMKACSSDAVADLTYNWPLVQLTPEEDLESLQLSRVLRIMGLLALICLFGLSYIGGDVLASHLATTVGWRSLLILKFLYFANFALVLPLTFQGIVARNIANLKQREVLGRLRFANSLFSVCRGIWFRAAIAFLVFRWVAPRL